MAQSGRATKTAGASRAWPPPQKATRRPARKPTRAMLYQELRPQARGLVDAFAIPDEVLAAPIAV